MNSVSHDLHTDACSNEDGKLNTYNLMAISIFARLGRSGMENVKTLGSYSIPSLLHLYISRIIYFENENSTTSSTDEILLNEIDKINYYSMRADLMLDYII